MSGQIQFRSSGIDVKVKNGEKKENKHKNVYVRSSLKFFFFVGWSYTHYTQCAKECVYMDGNICIEMNESEID